MKAENTIGITMLTRHLLDMPLLLAGGHRPLSISFILSTKPLRCHNTVILIYITLSDLIILSNKVVLTSHIAIRVIYLLRALSLITLISIKIIKKSPKYSILILIN